MVVQLALPALGGPVPAVGVTDGVGADLDAEGGQGAGVGYALLERGEGVGVGDGGPVAGEQALVGVPARGVDRVGGVVARIELEEAGVDEEREGRGATVGALDARDAALDTVEEVALGRARGGRGVHRDEHELGAALGVGEEVGGRGLRRLGRVGGLAREGALLRGRMLRGRVLRG